MDDTESNNKLFVAGFGEYIDEQDLEKAFSRFGKVEEVHIWRHPKTNDSEGWGFVEMCDSDDAAEAMRHLNGSNLLGRRLKVAFARSRT